MILHITIIITLHAQETKEENLCRNYLLHVPICILQIPTQKLRCRNLTIIYSFLKRRWLGLIIS